MKTLLYFNTQEGKKELYPLRNKFVVYCLTNLKNNKKYIGLTNKVRQRINQHVHAFDKGSKQYIHKALNLYGAASFSFEVLEECIDRFSLNLTEIKYIDYYKSTDLSLGYNLTYGGKSSGSTPENTKNRIKASVKKRVGKYDLKGNLLHIYNSVKEASRCDKIPDTDIHRCCKNRWSRNNYMYSKCLSEKILPYHTRRGLNLKVLEPCNKIQMKLLNLKTNDHYEGDSITEVCVKAGIATSTYHRSIKQNKNKTWKIMQ